MLVQGAQWMKQVVSFDKLKLTNNQLDDNGHVSSSLIFVSISILFERPLPGDSELDAQVPAAISSGEGQWYSETALQHISHLCFQGDRVYRRNSLSKWKGESYFQIFQMTVFSVWGVK